MAELRQGRDVLERADTPGVDDVATERAGDRLGRSEVETLKRAIDRNVRVNDGRHAGQGEALREVHGAEIGRLGPAVGRDHSIPRVDRYGEAVGMPVDETADELGVVDGRRTDHDARRAGLRERLSRVEVADAA